jgi:6-phosphogluconolactonase
MTSIKRHFVLSITALVNALLVSCGGSDAPPSIASSPQPAATAPAPAPGNVNASVSGLRAGGTATLLVTSGSLSKTITVSENGQAVVATGLPAGAAYSVSLTSKPDYQSCPLSGASGTIQAGITITFSMDCTENPMLALVANSALNAGLSAYTIDSATGSLTAVVGSPFAAGTAPQAITTSPDGRFAYVANRDSGDVSAFSIHPSTGALTSVPGSPFAAGRQPYAVTVSPNGRFVYVANFGGGISAYTMDSSTGALSNIAGSPFSDRTSPRAIEISADGQVAYVADYNGRNLLTFAIDPDSGALTLSRTLRIDGFPRFLRLSLDGQVLYVINEGSGAISSYGISPTTGELVFFRTAQVGDFSTSIALRASGSNGNVAYVTDASSNTATAYSVRIPEQFAQLRDPQPTGANPSSIALSPDGRFAYIANENFSNTSGGYSISAFSIDSGSGVLSSIGTVPAGTAPKAIATTRVR